MQMVARPLLAPHRQPRRLSRAEEEPILRARRETNLGPGRLAGICRRARSTIWKVLHRHGLSRGAGAGRRPPTLRVVAPRRPAARRRRPPGALRPSRPRGHRRPRSDRARRSGPRGYVYLHCVIDDHSRYAYVEQHPDQGGDTAAAVLGRAIDHLAGLGLDPPEAVMSDNAFAYRRSRAFGADPRGATAPDTSSPRPTRPAGTGRSSASSRP